MAHDYVLVPDEQQSNLKDIDLRCPPLSEKILIHFGFGSSISKTASKDDAVNKASCLVSVNQWSNACTSSCKSSCFVKTKIVWRVHPRFLKNCSFVLQALLDKLFLPVHSPNTYNSGVTSQVHSPVEFPYCPSNIIMAGHSGPFTWLYFFAALIKLFEI
ncbi:hypothetical protein RCL_jg15732.t1 [Rhizophagus clarus]|uniref:Uncharacterized protein n=1 Tax=Rhizophagus clarus TaxID=94130 RepID=A0A8H3R6W3_9GLOM|nr:hypothetical protein RCL_jg15732.t1 [Rhizophagus clarus]